MLHIQLRSVCSSLQRQRVFCRKIYQGRDNRLRRAFLYVPGDDERKIAKTQTLEVDSVILDCEDGVAQNRKQNARETISETLGNKMPPITNWGVRINSTSSGYLPDDIGTLFCGSVVPQTIYFPKVDGPEDLDFFYAALEKAAYQNQDNFTAPDVFIYAESCFSVMDLPAICRHAIALSRKCSTPLFRLVGIVFGSDDFCASLGAVRTESSLEILYARQRIVLIAKAFGLQAVDMVDINLNDLDGLRRVCLEGARMGYTGKQVIHPKQVETVQETFKPSTDVREWAVVLLKAYEEHQRSGKGAFVFRNQMIDAPTMKQARNIMEIMQKIEK